MDVVTNNRICRCCYAEGTFKDLISTHLWMGESEVYGDIIKECFDIHLLNIADDESSGICELCIISLRNANHFKKQVLKSEELFKKNLLEDKNSVKLEEAINAGGNVNVEVEIDHVPDYVPHKFEELELPIKSEIHFTDELTIKKKKRKLKTESNTSDKSDIKTEREDSPGQAVKIKTTSETTCDLSKELEMHKHNIKTILNYSNATPINVVIGTNKFCCLYCSETFTNPSILKTHTIKEHNNIKINLVRNVRSIGYYRVKLDITGLKCTLCEKRISSLVNFGDHVNNEHEKNFYKHIKSHIMEFKFEENNEYICVFCSEKFVTIKLLLQHMNKHYRNYICKICDKGFICLASLKNHENIHIQGVHRCEICKKYFKTNRYLVTHQQTVHLGGRRNKCPICNERFDGHSQRTDHLVKMHGIAAPVHACNACDRSFDKQNKLSRHIRRVHLMERKYSCAECDMTFFNKRGLELHSVKHSGQKSYECEVCLKKFGRKNTLKEHLRIHANDRKFKCTECTQSFVQKCSLKSHLRSRHGIAL